MSRRNYFSLKLSSGLFIHLCAKKEEFSPSVIIPNKIWFYIKKIYVVVVYVLMYTYIMMCHVQYNVEVRGNKLVNPTSRNFITQAAIGGVL